MKVSHPDQRQHTLWVQVVATDDPEKLTDDIVWRFVHRNILHMIPVWYVSFKRNHHAAQQFCSRPTIILSVNCITVFLVC